MHYNCMPPHRLGLGRWWHLGANPETMLTFCHIGETRAILCDGEADAGHPRQTPPVTARREASDMRGITVDRQPKAVPAIVVAAATVVSSTLGAACLLSPPPSEAATVSEISNEIKDVKAQVEEMHARAEEASERVHETQIQMIDTETKVVETEDRLTKARSDLARQCQADYKAGGSVRSAQMEAILGSASFEDMEVNAKYATSLRDSIAESVRAIRSERDELSRQHEELERQREELEAGQREVDEKVSELEARLDSLSTEMRASIMTPAAGLAANRDDAYAIAMAIIGDDPVRKALIDAAYSCIGTPYGYGAYSPGVALDCSGFVAWSYSQIGVGLPHSSVSQCSRASSKSIDQLLPGDLIFWVGTSGGSASGSHVAMWLGNGTIIHASGPGVCVQGLYGGWNSCGSVI